MCVCVCVCVWTESRHKASAVCPGFATCPTYFSAALFAPTSPPVPQLCSPLLRHLSHSSSAVAVVPASPPVPQIISSTTGLQQRRLSRLSHLSHSSPAAPFVLTSPPVPELFSSGVCTHFATCSTALQQRRFSMLRHLSRSSSAALSHSSSAAPFVQASPPIPQLSSSAVPHPLQQRCPTALQQRRLFRLRHLSRSSSAVRLRAKRPDCRMAVQLWPSLATPRLSRRSSHMESAGRLDRGPAARALAWVWWTHTHVGITRSEPYSEHRLPAPSSNIGFRHLPPTSASRTFLQTLPELVTSLKGHSLSPRSCPPSLSAPSERFGW